LLLRVGVIWGRDIRVEEQTDTGRWQRAPFLSRRFVIGSSIAFVILAANAFLTYRTIANLIQTSGAVENTLKVIEALKDVQNSVAGAEVGLRGYILSGERERLAQAHEYLGRAAQPIKALRARPEAAPGQAERIESVDALIGEELQRLSTLIEIDLGKGMFAAIRSISATGGAAAILRVQDLVQSLLAAEDAELAARTAQSRRSSDLSVITAVVATLFNLGLLGIVILLARREIKERQHAEEVVKFAATHDPLTGLPNRVLLAERVNRAVAAAKSEGRTTAVLFIDLDRFKNINDALGHEAGDRLLQNVADRLVRCVRRSDTVARQGGDEFVVLIEAFQAAGDLTQVAEKILAEVAGSMTVYGKEFQITASVGISTFPADGEDLQALLKNADIAMYRAKLQGNAYQFYAEQMSAHSVERLELEAALRRALERDELRLHYQPKVDARTGRVTGIECLLRWQHPTLGTVQPDQLVPLAEETGLIVPIGKWALRTACLQSRAWAEQGLPLFRLAVNLSARQFMSATLLVDVIEIIADTGMNPRLIEFEVTESMMMREPEEAVKLLRDLKAIGVRLTIDDFGTGYSSLAYLKRLPIDCVKIDASFIRGIPFDASDVAITETVIAMSGSLGLKVVAEGVETRDQAMFLEQRGCDEMQGFYFSKPLPAEELAAYLRQEPMSEESAPREAKRGLKLVGNAERRIGK
jgi:diguanylate cyclase (GGDEF)-like protein